MVEVTQLKDIAGDVINPATLEELQALKKGTSDLGGGSGSALANAVTNIQTIAGLVWVISAIIRMTGAVGRSHCKPLLRVGTNQVQPHRAETFAVLVDQYGLNNDTGRAKVLLDDTTNNWYVIHYDLSASPIWVPSGSNFNVTISNTHGATNITTFTGVETVT